MGLSVTLIYEAGIKRSCTFVVPVEEYEFGIKSEIEGLLADVFIKFVVEKRVRIFKPSHCFHVKHWLVDLLGSLHSFIPNL